MRGAADWSMRELSEAAAVSLATVLKIEQGGHVSERVIRRIRAAFRGRGVWAEERDGMAVVRIAERGPPEPGRRYDHGLGSLPYVTARGPRADGTFRVFFEVPANRRPEGWPATTPLPLLNRRGDLSDPDEVARIRRDAKAVLTEFEDVRARAGR